MAEADSTVDNFRQHWCRNASGGVNAAKLTEAEHFLSPLVERIHSGVVRTILDVGCGDGVHAAVLSRPAGTGCRYWGVDLSADALGLARERNADNVTKKTMTFRVADALSLPFTTGQFDAAFAYGVLAYTGQPERALEEMIRVVRPGGMIGIWLYPSLGGWKGWLFGAARKVCHWMGPAGARLLASLVVPLLPLLPVRSGVNLFNSTWRECREVVEVNLLPPVLDFYREEEVRAWFERRGLTLVADDADRPITLWARVPEQGEPRPSPLRTHEKGEDYGQNDR